MGRFQNSKTGVIVKVSDETATHLNGDWSVADKSPEHEPETAKEVDAEDAPTGTVPEVAPEHEPETEPATRARSRRTS